MSVTDLDEMVAFLRSVGRDDADVEVKKAAGGMPRSVRDTLSAFANTRGGLIVLGLDEESGFAATGVADAGKMSADLAAVCAEMEPPLRPVIQAVPFEGVTLVIAEVPELLREQKPCFYRGAGIVNGSFVRVGDSDRRMTSYEVQLMLANRGQPRHDEEPVPGTGIDDLNPAAVSALLDRLRKSRPHAYAGLDDHDVLRRMRVLVRSGDGEVLSVAGLLALGRVPQEQFPQLALTFVHYPTPDGAELDTGVRYLDSIVAEGPIPIMVQDTMQALRRNMKRRAVISGVGRQDVWEYPEVALREAVVNALVHRDLSPDSCGTQVQVEMYPDRLVIRNPGGLFGPVTVDHLGEEGASSARNATLLRLLRDVVLPEDGRPVCENIGSGIRTMVRSLRAAGMRAPEFRDRIAQFSVIFPNHSLLGAEVVGWIEGLGARELTESQCLCLAVLRDGGFLDNSGYRRVTGVDSRVATTELQDLVSRGLVAREGTGRWTRYQLAPTATPNSTPAARRADRRADILTAIGAAELTRAQIAARTHLPDSTTRRWLATLVADGEVEQIGRPRSPNVRYRRVTRPTRSGPAAAGHTPDTEGEQ
ncbi:ATP-binding protein [Nocardia cyriacigeorgica]|uniref:ATP-binding protein n=1 Tax=Nocardia cyriacigeorgica TaxID=135487 RepID=UPI001893CE29|nr:ATP-binding protein [Nocardia cyriacigeorgica]MBF6093479.1 putative DNA binding domain-containing protein [Nocardia cyriacigeorgica]